MHSSSSRKNKFGPNIIMEKILQAIYDKKQLLWFNALKRIVESHEYLGRILYRETFLSAIKKLREVKILKYRLEKKKKRVPIRFTKEAYEKYKIGSLQIPETYQSESKLKTKKLKRQPTIRKRRRRDSGYALRGKIIQYFLSRAAMGCYYNVEVTDRPPKKGDYSIFKDKNGIYYTPRDKMYLNKEQINGLIPVVSDGFPLPGVSITDLVEQRDSNCGGVFRYLEVTTKEAKKILDELIDSHILVPSKKSDVSDIFSQTRYVIENSSLSSYIFEHYELLSWVLDRMGLIWLADHPTRDEIEWYMYY